jgi:hypothetical protein
MARTTKKAAPAPGRQAPVGAWSPSVLLTAQQRGSDEDKVAVLKTAGILDAQGNLTEKYKNWGAKVTRTPDA